MSHIVKIRTEVRDREAVCRACSRLELPDPVEGETTLFQTKQHGLLVQLRGWHYPVVCDLQSGTLAYDNFNGHWGEETRLNEFRQMYAVEKATLEARRRGHSVQEVRLPNGAIKLSIGMTEDRV